MSTKVSKSHITVFSRLFSIRWPENLRLEASVSVLHAIPVGDDVWGCCAVRDRRSPNFEQARSL